VVARRTVSRSSGSSSSSASFPPPSSFSALGRCFTSVWIRPGQSRRPPCVSHRGGPHARERPESHKPSAGRQVHHRAQKPPGVKRHPGSRAEPLGSGRSGIKPGSAS